jgi:hypothetical protein
MDLVDKARKDLTDGTYIKNGKSLIKKRRKDTEDLGEEKNIKYPI